MNAQLDVHGPRANPTVQGFLKLDDGKLALAADARVYQDIKLDVAINDGVVTLKSAQAKVQDGSINASGRAKLARAQAAVGRPDARRRTSSPSRRARSVRGSTPQCRVHGEQTPEGMSGTIVVEKGTANLPKIAGGKKLQSTGPLEDVKFVDARRATRRGARRKAAEKEPATTELVAQDSGAVPRALARSCRRIWQASCKWRSSGRWCA